MTISELIMEPVIMAQEVERLRAEKRLLLALVNQLAGRDTQGDSDSSPERFGDGEDFQDMPQVPHRHLLQRNA